MTIPNSPTYPVSPGLPKVSNGERPRVSRELANSLAHRGTLGRIVALVSNERLVQIVFEPKEQLYYISPLPSLSAWQKLKNERFVISGSSPFRARQEEDGYIKPAIMHESNIQPREYRFQQLLPGTESWIDTDENVTADRFVDILRGWMDWDVELTRVFAERIRCSALYLADAYAEDRSCPTRQSEFIVWEQAIVEGNEHPLHKCRMPVDPRTQATTGVDFKRATITFVAVKRTVLTTYGQLETELEPLLNAAGIDPRKAADNSELVIPVHDFQVKFLLSLPQAAGQVRLLPQKVSALGQSSTRSMTVPSLPGIAVKLSLSLIIGGSLRAIDSRSAFSAVQYWTAGMFNPIRVIGLQGTPLELLPEVACANGLDDHLAVMIRWDPYHSSRVPVDPDTGYAVTGALSEPAVFGKRGSVAECVFELDSLSKRGDFLRNYTRMYFRCFLKPLFCNSLLFDAHGQNSLLRFHRSTGQLLGFSVRDMSGTRFNRAEFERTTGIEVDERMSNHELNIPDLLERAYFIFFVVHLWPLIIALDLHRSASDESWQDRAGEDKASDLTRTDGWAIVVHELYDALTSYETVPAVDAASISARELSKEARIIWLNKPTWSLRCYISQRMRSDWTHRDELDKASTVQVPNMLIANP